MDNLRKKELLEAYKNRERQMGVITFKCLANDISFFGISIDAQTELKSNKAKLAMNYHLNEELQSLWNEYGADKFTYGLVKELKEKDQEANYHKQLEVMLDVFLSEPKARMLALKRKKA